MKSLAHDKRNVSYLYFFSLLGFVWQDFFYILALLMQIFKIHTKLIITFLKKITAAFTESQN